MDVRGKHVLVFGLGLLGGGLATTQWLLREGAIVRVTDKKDHKALRTTLNTLGSHPRLSFTLGRHSEEDIVWADLVVVNPGVPKESPYLSLARKLKKPLWNDTALFFSRTTRPIIGVTGTRGKTTVTAWIAQLLSQKGRVITPTGNTPDNPLLQEIRRRISGRTPVVAELSSWQLELLPVSHRAPHVAVITNLYPDHLNRYRSIRQYADAKANIFLHQKKNDVLIVNADHPWTQYFLRKGPRSKILYASVRPLKKGMEGICIKDGNAIVRIKGKTHTMFSVERFRKERGEHNLMNLLQATLASMIASPSLKITEEKTLKLIAPRFRQEIILKRKGLVVVNDTTATSPDGTIAALRRFCPQGKVVLIAGGTDKELDFADLAKEMRAHLTQRQIILLEGSATKKLRTTLGSWGKSISEEQTLLACLGRAIRVTKQEKEHVTILFSPGSASFEKFKNEFDRGEQFNTFVHSLSW